MSFRIEHFRVDVVSRERAKKWGIEDTLAFVEDWEFLKEFGECGLSDDDLATIQVAITMTPTAGDVVPVSKHIRDAFYRTPDETVVIRYVYLPPPASTVLLLTAYFGTESYLMTTSEAEEAEEYIGRQFDYFSKRYTR